MKSSLLTQLLMLSVLAIWPAAWAQEGALSPQDIKATWTDKTIISTIQGGPLAGKNVELRLKSDGTIKSVVFQVR